TVTLTSTYAAGSIIQHAGYVISGTTQDGIYLDVRDVDTSSGCGSGVNCPSGDVDYFLDTPPGQTPPSPNWHHMNSTGPNYGALPLVSTRTFSAGASTGATLLK